MTAACRAAADRALDLNPLNTVYALSELEPATAGCPSAQCAFDMAFRPVRIWPLDYRCIGYSVATGTG